MKKMILILLLTLGGRELFSQSASPNLNSVFTADVLNEEGLYSFEKRADQKVHDFYSYLKIVSDAKTEIKLRQEARKQALELFASPSCTVDGTPVDKMLDSCIKISGKTFTPFATTTTIKHKLSPGTDSPVYTGDLEFILCYNSAHLLTKKADFLLMKTEKQFGKEKKQVWTVFLCNIQTIKPD